MHFLIWVQPSLCGNLGLLRQSYENVHKVHFEQSSRVKMFTTSDQGSSIDELGSCGRVSLQQASETSASEQACNKRARRRQGSKTSEQARLYDQQSEAPVGKQGSNKALRWASDAPVRLQWESETPMGESPASEWDSSKWASLQHDSETPTRLYDKQMKFQQANECLSSEQDSCRV